MTGRLRHLGGDRWQITVYAGKVDGKQRQKSHTFHAATEQEAKRTADGHADQLRKVAKVEADEADAPTMRALVDGWINDGKAFKSPTTIKGYGAACDRIKAEWGRLPVTAVTTPMVRAWYTKLANAGMTQATIEHHHVILRAILRQAVADNLVARPATTGVKRPKAATKEIKLPRDVDVLGYLARADGDLYAALRLTAATGLRRGEVVAVRWSDIVGRELLVARAHIEVKGGIQVVTTKGKRERRLPLDYGTLRVLAAHRKRQRGQAKQLRKRLGADPFIFADIAKDPTGQTAYQPNWLSAGWERARKPSKMRLHDLRHWYAVKLLESREVTIAELSAALGHAQVSTTLNIYANHIDDSRRRKPAGVMGRVLAGQKGTTP